MTAMRPSGTVIAVYTVYGVYMTAQKSGGRVTRFTTSNQKCINRGRATVRSSAPNVYTAYTVYTCAKRRRTEPANGKQVGIQ